MVYRVFRLLLLSACLATLSLAAPPGPAKAPKDSKSSLPPQSATPPGLAEKAPLDPALVAKADSLRRAIERRTYSEADKKEIRACDREKSDFLKQARAADPEFGKVDKALLEARIAGGSPNDPAVLSLLERKFVLEKAFDERYAATARGKTCNAGAARRLKAVTAALEKDTTYQDLLKRIAASSSDHL